MTSEAQDSVSDMAHSTCSGVETKMLSCVFLKMTFKTKPISEMKGMLLVNKSEVSNLLGNKLSDVQETGRTGHRMCDCPLAETVQEIVYEFWWIGLKKSHSCHSDQCVVSGRRGCTTQVPL